jgi:hypothetical protein
VDQRQADQRLWLSELEKDAPKLPDFNALRKWNHGMTDCEKVDPDNKLRYHNTGGKTDAEEITRMVSFLDRHGLWVQFQAEDKAGKR